MGMKTYYGKVCPKCSTSLRNLGGGCVKCNRDKARERARNNPKDTRERQKRFYQENKAYKHAQGRKYYAAKTNAVPGWADLKAIQQIYENCPKGMEVDHIYPLRGRTVCGLHVEDNLQYMTPEENRRKGRSIL